LSPSYKVMLIVEFSALAGKKEKDSTPTANANVRIKERFLRKTDTSLFFLTVLI